MTKQILKLTKFGNQEFHLETDKGYFGSIKAIPNIDQTGYAVIYKQQIPALSGPPLNKEVYLESIKNLEDLETIAKSHSKLIAKKHKYSLSNLANLSANSSYINDIKKKILPGQASPL